MKPWVSHEMNESNETKKGTSHTQKSEQRNNHRIINLNNGDMLFIRLNIY